MDKITQKDTFEKYIDNYTLWDKLQRLAWNVCWALLFRPFGLPIFKGWRSFVLRCWGAKIGKGSLVHASATIWAPWNLELGQRTCIGPHTIIYSADKIILGNKVAISQYAYLCTASHDFNDPHHRLITAPIRVEDYAWVAAEAYVGMGVTVGEGAVVGARASVYKSVEPWTVVGGNPARFLKKRVIR